MVRKFFLGILLISFVGLWAQNVHILQHAIDRGLPATGIVGVAGQEERGRAYSYYIEHGFARSEIIGVHYFQWLDQPITGRYDGENYNIGFLDVTFQPYRSLVKFAAESNEKIYRIAAGLDKPTEIKGRPIPAIFY